MSTLDPNVYRTALDLVAARQQDEYDVFIDVLAELTDEYAPVGVLGVFAVTRLSLRQASLIASSSASAVLAGLRVEAVPEAQPVVPIVLTLLYTSTEDPRAATSMARELGADERAEASIVVLADVSIAMAERVTRFSGLPGPQVVAAWRQQTEDMLARRGHAA